MKPDPLPPPDQRLEATPRLEGLLDALRGRLRRQVLLYGFGTLLGVIALWLTFAFLADWGLRVPRAVRVFHGLVLIGLVLFFAWRSLLRPLLRLPDRAGLALLLERANTDLRQLLISAVQFQGRPEAGNPELIRRVLERADARAEGLDTRGVLDESTPRARFLLGLLGAVVFLGAGLARPQHAGIFLDRLLGGSRAWPQRTQLVVDVPVEGPGVQIVRSAEEIQLKVARGADVPVLIEAEGVVPDEVVLHFQAGRDLVLTKSGGRTFRTLLRSCQENLSFHVTGGDDDDGLPHVSIEVLRPPDVEGIAIAISPPAYSGVEPRLVFDRDVEVLHGSRIRVHVLPQPADAHGIARLLPEDVELPLEPASFPAAPDEGEGADDGPASTRDGLAFQLVANETVGFRVELTDGTGLSNPDPGLFRVKVVEDRAPEVRVLAPGRSEFEVVRGGAFPLRARAEDDFGLVDLRWSALTETGEEATEVAGGEFVLTSLDEEQEPGAARPMRAGLGSTRVEVDDLGSPEAPVSVDQRFVIQLSARDNRRPEPGEGLSSTLRARVVTPEELLRRMQERLAQARLTAVRLSDLQREKRRRVEELLEALDGDDAQPSREDLALTAALSGQRRTQGDAQGLAHDLASVAEDILYARLDEKAGALLEFYDGRAAAIEDFRFHPEPWTELAAAQRAGSLGSSGFAGNLVELVEVALEISEIHTRGAVNALSRAEEALGAAQRGAALVETIKLQTKSLERMDALLAQLAEWDNFQNILALTRDILNRQKALRERTQQFASEK